MKSFEVRFDKNYVASPNARNCNSLSLENDYRTVYKFASRDDAQNWIDVYTNLFNGQKKHFEIVESKPEQKTTKGYYIKHVQCNGVDCRHYIGVDSLWVNRLKDKDQKLRLFPTKQAAKDYIKNTPNLAESFCKIVKVVVK